MSPKRDSLVIANAKKTLSVSNIKSDRRENLQLRRVKYILSLFILLKAGVGGDVTQGVCLFCSGNAALKRISHLSEIK